MTSADDVFKRRYWGAPLPYADELASILDWSMVDARHDFASSRVQPSWEDGDGEALTISMLFSALENMPSIRSVISEDDSSVMVGEVAFIAARYPRLFMAAMADYKLKSDYFTKAMRTYREAIEPNSALAWVLYHRSKSWVWNGSTDILDDIKSFYAEGIPFDVAVQYVELGITNGKTIRRLIENNVDMSLVTEITSL